MTNNWFNFNDVHTSPDSNTQKTETGRFYS